MKTYGMKLILCCALAQKMCLSQIASLASPDQAIYHGTFYAAEWTPKLVALSIDSSRTAMTASEISGNSTRACKIHASAGSLFITAGIIGAVGKDGRATVHKIIGETLSRTTDGVNIIPNLTAQLVPALNATLSEPAAVALWKDGSAALQIVIARPEKGIATLRAVQFIVRRTGGKSVRLSQRIDMPS